MSTRSYSNHGYVVPATQLKSLLNPAFHEEFDDLVAAKDDENLSEFLALNLPPGYPTFAAVFHLNKFSDETEDLEFGVMYVMFEDEDLFRKVVKEEHQELINKGICPVLSRWVTCS